MSEMATLPHAKHATADDDAQKTPRCKALYPEQYEEAGKAIKENMMVDIAMLAITETGCHQPAACRPVSHETHLGFNRKQEQLRHLLPAAGRTARQESWRSGNSPTNRHSVQHRRRNARQTSSHCAISDTEKGIEQSKRLIAAL